MLSIQTNVNSLVAQQNLNVNNAFQSKTIQQLTSGYRINSSGDDAAGLAVANGFRNQVAELTQGVSNGNDGVAQLQIIDGGMANISQMLDRLQTLATQSASATFTGDRNTLNAEYQSVIQEIDRQAQSIGLSTGGHFATALGVYIGGGATQAGNADASNGTVTVDLSGSAVDSKALGLRTSDFEVDGAAGTDIGAGSATSVAQIAAANSGTDSGNATFTLSGPNFSGVSLTVNISGLSTPQQVADALNQAINTAGNSNTAFQQAGIQASVRTNSDGTQQLVFASNGSAFQVQAGTQTANALLGNFQTGATTEAAGAVVAGSTEGAGPVASSAANAEAVKLQVTLNGTQHTFNVSVAGTEASANALLGDVTAATDGGGSTLANLGITASIDSGTGALKFVGPNGTSMQVAVAGDQDNDLGMGTWQGDFATNTYTSSAAIIGHAGTGVMQFSLNGGAAINVALSNTNSGSQIAADITTAVNNNATLKAAGITANWNSGTSELTISSGNSVNFRVNLADADPSVDLKLTNSAGASVGSLSQAGYNALPAQNGRVDASGASETGLGTNNDVFSFAGLVNSGDQQTLGFTSTDANGNPVSTSITLTTSNAGSLDAAIQAINTQLQSNPTLKNIVAVKDMNAAGTAEGIRFVSSLTNFSVQVGGATNYTTANPVGMYDGTAGAAQVQGMTVASSESGSLDISTLAGAQQAVVAVGKAVSSLGMAQAAVGKGENRLNYAVNLAQSQITNFSSAESQLRDADVAQQAANLTKAQVLQQASIAAMAQANSAPQAVLSLLKG